MTDIVERLRDRKQVLRDDGTCRRSWAATALDLAAADEIERLREALKPFAEAANIRLCGGDYWTDDKSVQGTDIAFHVKFGHLRNARAVLK